jgi:pimeloyl-ACP methyl ester carboxylesterase
MKGFRVISEVHGRAAWSRAGHRPTGTTEEIVVVGHSLGGYVGPLVAEQNPVRHLVFLCAVPSGPGEPLSMGSTSVLTDDLINTVYENDNVVRSEAGIAAAKALTGEEPVVVLGGDRSS